MCSLFKTFENFIVIYAITTRLLTNRFIRQTQKSVRINRHLNTLLCFFLIVKEQSYF